MFDLTKVNNESIMPIKLKLKFFDVAEIWPVTSEQIEDFYGLFWIT